MLLQYLLEDLEEYDIKKGNTNIDIEKIEYDSNKISTNDLFVAIKGFQNDGNSFIEDAIKRLKVITR